jgi:hypothetical protein
LQRGLPLTRQHKQITPVIASQQQRHITSPAARNSTMSEPFPLLNTASDQLHNAGVPRQRRRKSSALGGEIRAGDTGAPAMATSRASMGMTDSSVSLLLI